MKPRPRTRGGIASIAILAFAVACASPPRSPLLPVVEVGPDDDPWNVVMGLEPGRLVLVGLTPGSAAHAEHGGEVRCVMGTADRSNLEVRSCGPDSINEQADLIVSLSRDEVRYLEVPASQDRPRKGGWLGLAIGAGGGAAVGAIGAGAGESGNFAAIVAPLSAAAFGFLGYLMGRGIDRRQTRGDFITIYGSDPSEEANR